MPLKCARWGTYFSKKHGFLGEGRVVVVDLLKPSMYDATDSVYYLPYRLGPEYPINNTLTNYSWSSHTFVITVVVIKEKTDLVRGRFRTSKLVCACPTQTDANIRLLSGYVQNTQIHYVLVH